MLRNVQYRVHTLNDVRKSSLKAEYSLPFEFPGDWWNVDFARKVGLTVLYKWPSQPISDIFPHPRNDYIRQTMLAKMVWINEYSH